MFAIENPTPVRIRSVNLRNEKHGDEDVPAIDIAISWKTSNVSLDQFDPALRPMFYTRPEEPPVQGVIEGTASTDTPLLRSAKFEPALKLKGEFAGYTLKIEHGIGDDSAIVVRDCKLGKMGVGLMEGGSIDFGFRVQSSSVDAEALGLIGSKIGQEATITLLPPAEVQGGVIDASSDGDAPGNVVAMFPGAGGARDPLSALSDSLGLDLDDDDDDRESET